MKERPILFSGPMVRAILEGRKTQTRRVMKPQPASVEYWLHGNRSDRLRGLPSMRDETGQGWAMCGPFRCPYIPTGMYAGAGGKLGNSRIGDTTERKSLLWVKETFRFASDLDTKSPTKIAESAIGAGYQKPWAPIKYEADNATNNADVLDDFGGTWGKTRVSIHMPRWASRITLEVKGVRVERLQEISEEDAAAEGAPCEIHKLDSVRFGARSTYRAGFERIWSEINGADSWSANPYVWVVSFRRVETEVAHV